MPYLSLQLASCRRSSLKDFNSCRHDLEDSVAFGESLPDRSLNFAPSVFLFKGVYYDIWHFCIFNKNTSNYNKYSHVTYSYVIDGCHQYKKCTTSFFYMIFHQFSILPKAPDNRSVTSIWADGAANFLHKHATKEVNQCSKSIFNNTKFWMIGTILVKIS